MIQLIQLHLFCNALWSKVICLPKKVLQSSTLWLSNPGPGGGGGTGWQQPWDQDTFTDQRNLFKVQSSGHFVKQAWHTCWKNKQVDGISFDPLSLIRRHLCRFFIKAKPGSSWVWVSIALCLRQHCRVSVWKYNWLGKRNMNQLCTSQRQKYIWTSGHQTLWTEFYGETPWAVVAGHYLRSWVAKGKIFEVESKPEKVISTMIQSAKSVEAAKAKM